MTILTVNAGSSNIKCALFDAKSLRLIDKTQVATQTEALTWVQGKNVKPAAVGHRVVHGGREFDRPARITPEMVKKLEAFIPLAPLHQPHNLALIKAFAEAFKDVPQIACFDTSFHAAMPDLERRFPLPEKFYDEGVVRYGFHGLSYEHIVSVVGEKYSRLIAVHLGGGASACAIKDRKSIATTMGFSALDGLVMGTRTGSLDPGVLLYLIEEKRYSAAHISDLLYKESGLKGVSGISADMRELEGSGDPRAALAIELFCYIAAKQIASLVVALGGLDGLVFTGGIGENSARVRETICTHLAWLGVGKKIPVEIIAADEERVIAKACQNLI